MSSDNLDKAALLRKTDFFSGCTERELDDVAKLAVDRHFAMGEELCRQGEAHNEAFAIVEGEAMVIEDGNEVGIAKPGDVVGELSMLGTGRRTATLRAIGPVHVLVVDPREVDSVLAADPSATRRLGRHDRDE